ncbi:TerD family protein [Pseudomonas mosselii]|uniref:TerD family protein n=1 Tax=Pseudomonas mosselii TaxID=78327 RepID=UPI0021DA01CA|nr:TerD family protein [Pseudomonas mosselii]MCU9528027.1 TerD family protein [Pseudomonas mosselii]MCU9535136.1 TerD family protein [Pseudomonas mosselii]MCU9542655.1 TerD family protein [Pseudomonas mosselii]MCU9546871.1 TerD family protein [Pseudomonas mosselii]
MNQSLKPGENTGLSVANGLVQVTHAAGANLDVNLTAFLLTDAGRVEDDSGMVFFNAPVHASGSATFTPPSNQAGVVRHSISFDLSRLPADIKKIAITLTQDGSGGGGFAQVKDLSAQVVVGDQVLALTPDAFQGETGITVLELYVRNGQAKARAVWQGFASGLAGLCNMYGVEVSDEPEPVVPAVAEANPVNITKSVITLDKPGATHKVSIEKGAAAPKTIKVSATWVDNGDGRDNDDLDLRIGILRPDERMSIIQAPDKRGSFESDPYVSHTGDVVSASSSAPGIETVEINPAISHRMGGRVALVCSVYSAVDNGAVSVASLKPKMRMEYGDQIVECAFEFKSGFFSSMVYTYVLGVIEIDGDAITISPSGVTSRTGSEATPWLTRKGNKVELTMDGPHVFKGRPLERSGKKQYI